MDESSIPHLPLVYLVTLDNAITRVTMSLYLCKLSADLNSCETIASWVHGDVGEGGLQIQHYMQCHCPYWYELLPH